MRDTTFTAGLEELPETAERILKRLPQEGVVFLRGDLAAGKTTLMQAVARKLGYTDAVTSPTFSLQHVYGEGLYHYDLYRIDDEEFERLGLIEEFEKPGLHFVEWGSERLEKFLRSVGYNVAIVTIFPEGTQRRYRIDLDAHT
jgi:tRNA threonylcarbamoyladenosine biosynthesis protein TsaE